MTDRNKRSDIPALVAGMALGAGIVLLRAALARKHPDYIPGQIRVSTALDKSLRYTRREGKLSLGSDHRYVIFSDHHKGARNKADDFRQCETTYLKALDYYLENGYSLIILGDAEEFWEEEIEDVMEAYENVFQSEARFYPDRYIRIGGNHDDAWEDEELISQYLYPFFPNIQVKPGLVFEYSDDEDPGDIFLVHGHQGTLDSDTLGFIGRSLLPMFRQIQIKTGIGRTTPADDACLRAEHDTRMYRWSSKKEKLMIIAGHTHRPVWSSVTHLEKLIRELYALQGRKNELPPGEYQKKVKQLKRQIKTRQEKYPPCTDTIKTRPSYFNTGCCRFKDGDITGFELVDGEIRLIKWGKVNDYKEPVIFERKQLAEVFAFL